jgi:hypothetical protein
MSAQHTYVCPSCVSRNIRKFGSEIGVRFKGIGGLENPVVFVFPEVVVCFNCGHAEFTIPETELRVIATNTPVENAATVLLSSGALNEQFQARTEVKPTAATTDESIAPKSRTKPRR